MTAPGPSAAERRARRTWSPRSDWAPQDRTELCACISVLALAGKLTPDDEAFIEGWIQFRRAALAAQEGKNV